MTASNRVHVFIPCLIDRFRPQAGAAVFRILQRLGMEPVYAERPSCCGQPFYKSGRWRQALPLAKTTISAFRDADMVVIPSGSCGTMIRHHYKVLFRHDPFWFEQAAALSRKVYEFSEFLIHVAGVDDLEASYPGRVTYHDSCQVLRGLGIREEPRSLLRKVRELDFVEMEDSDVCCGFGGVFSLKSPHVSRAMAEHKIARVAETGASAVVGCEISCLMHMEAHLERLGLPIRTFHLAEILDPLCSSPGGDKIRALRSPQARQAQRNPTSFSRQGP